MPVCPPPPLRWTDLLGVLALLLAGGALLCASTRSWIGLVIPIGAGGVLLGMLGILGGLLQGRLLLPAAGTTAAAAATMLALLFPGLLGKSYWMSRQPAPVTSMEIRAVSLTDGEIHPALLKEDWVDAGKTALQQGPLRLWVGSVHVLAAVNENEAAKKDQAPGDLLVVRIRMQVVEDARGFAAQQPSATRSRGDSLQPRLLDGLGRSLPPRDLQKTIPGDNAIRSSMFPVSVEDRAFAFALPSQGREDLRLEVPVEPLGGKGVFRFKIASSMMRRDSGGDVRAAPAPNR